MQISASECKDERRTVNEDADVSAPCPVLTATQMVVLMRIRLAVFGYFFEAIWGYFLAILGEYPHFLSYRPYKISTSKYTAPSIFFCFGADFLGADVFADQNTAVILILFIIFVCFFTGLRHLGYA